jgi:hypothetical protein
MLDPCTETGKNEVSKQTTEEVQGANPGLSLFLHCLSSSFSQGYFSPKNMFHGFIALFAGSADLFVCLATARVRRLLEPTSSTHPI